MLKWLFGSRPPADPPTEKQLRYARKLGITIPENTDKAILSQLIGQVESRDPSLKTKRENVKEKQRVRKHGQDKIDEEAQWQALADAEKWMLVVFTRGKSKVAEVVRINGADISTGGKIKIETEVMEITNDRHAGPLVDVERYIEISVDKIDWHEIVDEVDIDDVRRFQKYYDRVKSRRRKQQITFAITGPPEKSHHQDHGCSAVPCSSLCSAASSPSVSGPTANRCWTERFTIA